MPATGRQSMASAMYRSLCAGLEPAVGSLTARKAIEVACHRQSLGSPETIGPQELPEVLAGLRLILQGLIGRRPAEALLVELNARARRVVP